MKQYVSYIDNTHLLMCIKNLFTAYQRAKENTSKQTLYRNKVDIFKLTFDASFNGISEEILIDNEISRQIDKSINNAIGTFHEEILGGIQGYKYERLSSHDIYALDNTLFAEIKNKHNTMNSSASEAVYQKLKQYADKYKAEQAKCYWVAILAKHSYCEPWVAIINGKEYRHSRVYKISGDQFYALLTGKENALYELYQALPEAIRDFMSTLPHEQKNIQQSALAEIKKHATTRNLLDQIALDNYSYYQGFKDL